MIDSADEWKIAEVNAALDVHFFTRVMGFRGGATMMCSVCKHPNRFNMTLTMISKALMECRGCGRKGIWKYE